MLSIGNRGKVKDTPLDRNRKMCLKIYSLTETLTVFFFLENFFFVKSKFFLTVNGYSAFQPYFCLRVKRESVRRSVDVVVPPVIL